MLKVVQVIKKKPEVSFEDFEKQVLESYAKNLKKIPGVKSFAVKLVRGGYQLEERPFDCVAEMEFADEEAFIKVVEKPETKSILEELGRVAERSEFIYSEEHVIKRARAPAKPKVVRRIRRPRRKATRGTRKTGKRVK
ncbi:MAG: EthD domain-containing protein [Nitrososphaeria archaeon]|nr:EthD domain-containing protein [Aigarchaeota archaeon]MCX8187231.1 EthD domain-containing protein [Nitrososphaeria archaeon]MDW8021712.1 EthD domain-containing protein [Nitrososphaerota archaeon]